jgi:hypothetical protein
MRFLIVFFAFAHTLSFALSASEQKALNHWAGSKEGELFSNCEKTTRQAWLLRYEKVELEYIEKIEDAGDDGLKKSETIEAFWDMGQVVFPQVLPDRYPMKGAFLTCFDRFKAYRKANKKTVAAASGDLTRCYREAFQPELGDNPAVLSRFLACIPSLKD